MNLSELKNKSLVNNKFDIVLTDDIKRMVMSSCKNIRGILQSWNVHPVLINNKQWKGYCPEHVLHDGHVQHAPKWFMSAETGDCMCFTSSKASNFIYIAKRMYNFDTIEQTIKYLTDEDKLILPPPDFIVNEDDENRKILSEQNKKEEKEKGIAMVKKLLQKGTLSKECIEYFKNDGITEQTLNFLGICSIENGYLAGRAIIPFLDENKEICGYIAVNYMGKEWWVNKEYNKLHKIDSEVSLHDVEKSYRKTLYCPGFTSRNHLYGLYEVLNGADNIENLVIVQGERDAIKLLQEGIDCVAIHGTFLKDEQRIMLKKINPKRLFLGLDMDKAGNDAVMKIFYELQNEFENLYVLNFPENKDPKKFNRNELLNLIDYTIKNNIKERIVNNE